MRLCIVIVSFLVSVGANPEYAGYFIVLLNIVAVSSLVLPPLMRMTAGRICKAGRQETNDRVPEPKPDIEMEEDLVHQDVRDNPYVPAILYTHSGLRMLGTEKLFQMAEDYVKEAVYLQRFIQRRQVVDVFHSRKILNERRIALIRALDVHLETAKRNSE